MVSCVFMAAVSVFSACEQEAMVLGALGANAHQLNVSVHGGLHR